MEGESLRGICAKPGMPTRSTVFLWLTKNESFSDQYARAREAQADTYADECIYIADTETDAHIARVRIDARKWVAGKARPKKYGDKIEVEQNGQMVHEVKVSFVRPDPKPENT